MKQVDLASWEDLEKEVDKLRSFLKSRRSSSHGTISPPLFRGQSSYAWPLTTTLERYLDRTVSVERYHHHLLCIKPSVEAYTGTKWKLEDRPKGNEIFFDSPPNYHFKAYVRHHGFPSPLLDWTQSLCIALFFAFHNASGKERVAIYIFVELLGEGKGGRVGAPQICVMGPYVSTHKRHFMQQGQYTVAVSKPDDEWVYCSHEECFSAPFAEDQDYLMKVTLPGEIRGEVLDRLQSMNVNAFTLFGSEESLMDMLAYREILKKRL